MKTVALMLALASVTVGAMADETITLKDTRTYLNMDGKSVADNGELLTKAGDWCNRTVYEHDRTEPNPPAPGKQYIVLPNIKVLREDYRCDSGGKPI